MVAGGVVTDDIIVAHVTIRWPKCQLNRDHSSCGCGGDFAVQYR